MNAQTYYRETVVGDHLIATSADGDRASTVIIPQDARGIPYFNLLDATVWLPHESCDPAYLDAAHESTVALWAEISAAFAEVAA